MDQKAHNFQRKLNNFFITKSIKFSPTKILFKPKVGEEPIKTYSSQTKDMVECIHVPSPVFCTSSNLFLITTKQGPVFSLSLTWNHNTRTALRLTRQISVSVYFNLVLISATMFFKFFYPRPLSFHVSQQKKGREQMKLRNCTSSCDEQIILGENGRKN